MSDSHFVVCVLAMVAMVLGAWSRRRPDDDSGDQVPGAAATLPPALPEPTARHSPTKGKEKRKKK